MSNGSSELISDDVDATGTRVRQAIENVQKKITKTRDSIRTEQTTRDGTFFIYFFSLSLICNPIYLHA